MNSQEQESSIWWGGMRIQLSPFDNCPPCDKRTAILVDWDNGIYVLIVLKDDGDEREEQLKNNCRS